MIELFDQAFRFYRKHLWRFLFVVVPFFVLLLPITIIFINEWMDIPVNLVVGFLILGVDNESVINGVIVLKNSHITREIVFFDGMLPWTVFSTAIAVSVLRIEGVVGKLDRKIYLRVIGLAVLTTMLVLFLYLVDLPWLAVLLRCLWLFTPHLIVSETLLFSLGRGVLFVLQNIYRSLAVFCLSLLVVRLVITGTYASLYLFVQYVLQWSFREDSPWWIFLIGWWSVLFVLYPVVHIFVALSYRQFCAERQLQGV